MECNAKNFAIGGNDLRSWRRMASFFYIMVISILVFSAQSWGASGSVTINTQSGQTVSGRFTVVGSYVLTEDSTPTGRIYPGDPLYQCTSYSSFADLGPSCNDWVYAVNYYASAYYLVDDQYADSIGAPKWGCRVDGTCYSDLGTNFPFSISLNTASLGEGFHSVTVRLLDRISVYCERASSCTCIDGNIIAEETTVFMVGTPQSRTPGELGGEKKPRNGDDDLCKKGRGTPYWWVNPINMNLFVSDTPLWYKPPYGPSVDIGMVYNSLTQSVNNSPFGGKWHAAYSSYIIESSSTVTVIMPDGKEDVYPVNASSYERPFGVFNTLTKISDHRYMLSLLDGTVYTYAIPSGTALSNPVLIEIRDANNQALSIEYDGSGKIWKIKDALNRETTFSYYSGSNLVQTVTDPFGRQAGFEYYPNGNLSKATDMGGYWASYAYDSNGYLSSIVTAKGTWTIKTEPSDTATGGDVYPAPDAPMGVRYRITVTDPSSGKEEYFYDGWGAWKINPKDYINYESSTRNNLTLASKTYYTFDRSMAKGRISKSTTPGGITTRYTYDSATGIAKTITDGNSHAHTYEYNSNGLVTKYWDAKTATTATPILSIGYDTTNNIHPVAITNGLGSITYTYNNANNPFELNEITDRMTIKTGLAYNTLGQLTTVTEAAGTGNQTVTRLEYDSTTHTLKDIFKAGVLVASLTHDNIGRIASVTYPDGVVISYEYDNLDQTKTITYPDGRFESITNSTLCPYIVDSATDRAGRTTSYQYDALKRLIQRDGPDGTYKYGYDANSNMTTFTVVTDKSAMTGVDTIFGYNLDNRVNRKTYADGKYVTYTYDPAGLLKTSVNSRSQTSTYGYDENNNLTSIAYSGGATNVTFGYDPYNRMTSRTDAIGTFGYTYDANSRLKTVTYPWDSVATITYDYNDLNQLIGITPLLGTAVSYTYDTLGRLKTIKRATDTIPFTYDYNTSSPASPLVQKLTRPNGSYTTYEYNDQLKKLTALINRNSANEIISRYDYTHTNPSHPDLRNSETITNGTVIDNFAAGTTTYTPNNLNQVTASANPALTYSYDDDGNMTTAYTTDGYQMTLAYDAENRLTSAQHTGAGSVVYKTAYEYGADGLLAVMKKYQTDLTTPVTTTRYVRAGFLPIQERDASNNVTREYTWGLNYGGGIGGLLNLKQGGLDYNYLYDGKGNVMALIDTATQAPVVAYAYDPFGVKMKQIGTFDQPYQFSTKMYDLQTGFSDFGYRHYNAILGKWMTRDPLGEAGGINLYGYVGNNPVNKKDPLGLFFPTNPYLYDPQFLSLSLNYTFNFLYGDTTCKRVCNGCIQLPTLVLATGVSTIGTPGAGLAVGVGGRQMGKALCTWVCTLNDPTSPTPTYELPEGFYWGI